MSNPSRHGLPLALLACLGTGAAAQSPLPIYAPGHHRLIRMTPPSTPTPALTFGRSLVTAPRFGSADLFSPLAPRTAGEELTPDAVTGLIATFDPWTSNGPGPLLNGGGAFGSPFGQNTSGRVAGIAADPTDPNIYYVASAGGGVWKTTNGGQTYKALTDFLGDTAMGSIVVAPSNHNVVYAGTGEANFSGDSRYGIGLLRSTDGGASWSVIPGPPSGNSPKGVFYRKAISRIVVDPTNSNVVYLSTAFAGLNGNGFPDGGVWKTTDGGVNWVNTTSNKVNNNAIYTDVVMNIHNSSVLYTTVGFYARNNGVPYDGNGVFKTTDGGQNWVRLTGGLPQASAGDLVGGQTTLALYSSNDGNSDTLYVSIPNVDTGGLLGLYKSTNSGASFAKLTAPNYLGGQAFYDNAVVVSPNDPNVFFAAGQVNYAAVAGFGTVSTTNYNDLRCLVGTTDGGATFHDYSLGINFGGPHTDTHALIFTPDGKLLDGNDGGVWRLENPLVANPAPPTNSSDASNSNIRWSNINGNLNTLQFTGIALNPSDAAIAYGGAQDNGTSKLANGVWNQIIGGDGGFTRVDPANPQTVYQEFYGISLDRSDDGGQTFVFNRTNGINPNDPNPDFNPVGILDDGSGTDAKAFYVPYKLDPLNPSHVIYGTNHIYLSTNRADNFTAIGIPGASGNGFAPSLASNSGAYVNALGVAGPTIYAEINRQVFATFDNGAHWADRSIPATLGKNSLTDIHVNPANPLDVYATKGAFDDSSVGKVFRSTNGGLNWANISSNLPDEPFNSVRLDRKSGTLYVAGDDGVYSSTNYGGSWSRISGSLPNVQVTELDLSNTTGLLGAGTHGRGLWTTPLSTVIAKPNLRVIPTLTRTPAGVTATLTVSNFGNSALPVGVGNADALNAALTVMLNGQVGTPVAVGPVPAYGSAPSVTVSFTNVPAGYTLLRYTGTYTGGGFAGSQRISVP